MTAHRKYKLQYLCVTVFVPLFMLFQGCMSAGTAIQWNSRKQILDSEDSQVKMRTIQSQVFDTTDRAKILRAATATIQDLFFDITVLDEELFVVSGKKWLNENAGWANHPSYYLYSTDELMIFNTNFRNWGPFCHRKDLVRITLTVRPKEETRSLVRVSIQYNLMAIEDPETYQKFFRLLRQSLFLSEQEEPPSLTQSN